MIDTLKQLWKSWFGDPTPAPKDPIAEDDREDFKTEDDAVRDAIAEELVACRVRKGWSSMRGAKEMGVDGMYFEGVEMGIILPSPSERYPYLRKMGVARTEFILAVCKRVGKT